MDKQQIYTACLDKLHEAAKGEGFAKQGVLLINDIIPAGSKVAIAFLNDAFFKEQFRQDVKTYYYVITMLCLQAGMVISKKWHEAPELVTEEYINKVIEIGPAQEAENIWRDSFGVSGMGANRIYAAVFNAWLEFMADFWEEKEPRDYIFNSILAAYQTGISIMMEGLMEGVNDGED